ncbi:MAG: acyl-CoA thioesterase [Ignavibacteriaceae bacterium]|jgi:acyl-CoA thioester hydrolase/1,4-dihydroxy-2-naphthoyl-CoA hydrolase
MVVSKTRIDFFDADAAGVMFYGKVFELCHSAFESFISSQKKYKEYFSSQEYAFPIIHTEASYFFPLIPGEEVNIEISLGEIKNSSFSLLYQIKKAGGEIAVEAKTVTVSVEKKKWQKIALPPFVKELLQTI